MDYQCTCNECSLALNSPESLEMHRQFHEGHFLQTWTQNVSNEEKNNNSPRELQRDYFGGTSEMVYGHPPTPQCYQSSSSPYQEYVTQATNLPLSSFAEIQDYANVGELGQYYDDLNFNLLPPLEQPHQPLQLEDPLQDDSTFHKCGFVCESALQLNYEPPKEESQILDLDSQNVVPQWSPTPFQGQFQILMPPQPPQSQGVVPPPAPPPQKSTNWKSNEARRPKTYNCISCNKWFTSSAHLKRHYNTRLHKNAVKSSGLPDPDTMTISHHHPARGSASSKDDESRSSGSSREDSTSKGSEGSITQHQPLPSFAEIQDYANVGGLGQYYVLNLLPPLEQTQQPLQLEEVPVEQKENPPPPPASQPPLQDESETKCYDCDKVFTRPCYLKQHNKTFHDGDKPYKCSRCGKRFCDDETYRRHARKHVGDKPHKCDMCSKMFNYKSDLKRHLCFHTGKKPYACEICGQGFIRKDHMIKHTDRHARKREKMAASRT